MNPDGTTYDGTINARILDSVAVNAGLVTGQSPSQAFGMLDTVMAETLGMAMHNAVLRQQSGSMVSSAAVTAACAKMLQSPYVVDITPAPPPHPTPSPKPDPLDPPSKPAAPAATIAAAVQEGEEAVKILKREADEAAALQKEATAGLNQIAQDAAPPPPPAPPAPPAPPSPPPPADGGQA